MIQLNDIKSKLKANSLFLPFYVLAFLMLASCAKMGQPDGGWFDETPPKVIGASPADKGVNVKQKKVNIYFDEYIKVDNPTEKVVVSPPQLEVPEIKASGKHIQISLVDSLKPNTTYTIDFPMPSAIITRAIRWETIPTVSLPERSSIRWRCRDMCSNQRIWSLSRVFW